MSTILENLSLEHVTPMEVWQSLDQETQLQAGIALFKHDWNDTSTKRDAIRAIAMSIRFREVAVQKMPLEKRAKYLITRVPLDDGFVSTLLMAFHMVARRPLLTEFLDRIGVQHADGLIDDSVKFPTLGPELIETATAKLREGHPDDQVDLYLVSLLAMDDDWWGALRPHLEARKQVLTT